MGYFKEKFRSIKKFPRWIFWFPAKLMQVVMHTLYRVRYEDPNGYIENGRGYVALMWHNRLFFFASIFPKATRKDTVAVVSASRDGQYIVDFVSHFGVKCLRGSSSRKGVNAQRQAIKEIKDGKNVVFTPDGPRGPKYRLKPGPLHLAQTTGRAIVPMCINASHYWQIRSWDNFQIPKPFSTLTLVMGDEIPIPADLAPEDFNRYLKKVEDAMLAITED